MVLDQGITWLRWPELERWCGISWTVSLTVQLEYMGRGLNANQENVESRPERQDLLQIAQHPSTQHSYHPTTDTGSPPAKRLD